MRGGSGKHAVKRGGEGSFGAQAAALYGMEHVWQGRFTIEPEPATHRLCSVTVARSLCPLPLCPCSLELVVDGDTAASEGTLITVGVQPWLA